METPPYCEPPGTRKAIHNRKNKKAYPVRMGVRVPCSLIPVPKRHPGHRFDEALRLKPGFAQAVRNLAELDAGERPP